MQAGIAQYQLGNRAAAEPLLTNSMQLLPTAPGAYYLGRLNEDRGNTAEAVHSTSWPRARSHRSARTRASRLARLDLAQNPDTYLSIQPQLDNQGRVWLTVGNRTTLPIAGVSIVVGDRRPDRPHRVRPGSRRHRQQWIPRASP